MISARLSRIARAFYAAHETSTITTSALSALDECRWEDLVRLRADPRHYDCPQAYFRDACVSSFLKKFDGEIPGVDSERTAIDKWWDAERQNYWTNQRLLPYVPLNYPGFRPGMPETTQAISEFFSLARKMVEAWVGVAPPHLCGGHFGPGATISNPAKLATVPDKISSAPTLTPGAMGYLLEWSSTLWAREALSHGRQPTFVRGDVFDTAPKTAVAKRALGKPPSLNVYYQLGLGESLKKRLRNATGWDLRTVQETHRRIAAESSVSREFATLDLSNASDTVSRNLVRVLWPRRWVAQLESLRSPITEIEGKTVYLEKFSSMGNGYTFELETITFASLCAAAMQQNGLKGELGKDLFVFGDDIIVPEGAVGIVTAVLKFCGLTINTEKSFWGQDRFRESCGGDFFDGVAVRPFHLKEEPHDLSQKISLVNGIRRVLFAGNRSPEGDRVLAWRRALDWVPRTYRHFGPDWLGDIVVHVPESEHWKVKTDQWGTAYIMCTIARGEFLPWAHWTPDAKLASLVYGTGDGLKGVIPRDPEQTYVSEWVPLLRNHWLPDTPVRGGPTPAVLPPRPNYMVARRVVG